MSGAGVGLLLAVALWPSLLQAADAAGPADGGKPDLWVVTVGGFGVLEPAFEGARGHAFGLRPQLGLRKDGARDWLALPNDGLDFEIIETDTFRAGPVASARWRSDAVGPGRGYRRVGSLDVSLEAGAFAEFWPAPIVRTRAELRGAVVGGEGLVVDLSVDLVLRPGEHWVLTAGPRVSAADRDYMDTWFGVNAGQAVATGLPAYAGRAGIKSYGAGTSLRYQWSDAWTTIGFVEASHLAGSAAGSPLVQRLGTPDQISVGAGATYAFRLPW